MSEVNIVRGTSYMPASHGKASSAPVDDTGVKTGNSLPVDTTPSAPETNGKSSNGTFLQDVTQAVAHMNEFIQSTQRDLHFTYDAELGDTIVKVIDSTTQEVIRQIPDEVFLKLARELNAGESVPLLQAQA